jgi:hypothetical protein
VRLGLLRLNSKWCKVGKLKIKETLENFMGVLFLTIFVLEHKIKIKQSSSFLEIKYFLMIHIELLNYDFLYFVFVYFSMIYCLFPFISV